MWSVASIDDNVAGQIIGFQLALRTVTVPVRVSRTGSFWQVARGIRQVKTPWGSAPAGATHPAGRALSSCESAQPASRALCDEVHRDGFAGKGGKRIRCRNASCMGELSGSRETCLAAHPTW